MVNVCPNIPDDWRGTIAEASKILGLHRDTIRKYADVGRQAGGLDWKPSKKGRKTFTGKEIKRFWREYR